MIEIESYLKERDAAVLAGGKAYHKFCVKHGRDMNPDVEEISLHKLRTALANMPDDVRQASRQWLTERGYQPWDNEE